MLVSCRRNDVHEFISSKPYYINRQGQQESGEGIKHVEGSDDLEDGTRNFIISTFNIYY